MSFRRFSGLAALALVAIPIAGALFLYRPWSAYNPMRLRRIFEPSERVENFRRMDRFFPFRRISASPAPFRFGRDERPLPVSYEFSGETRTLDSFLDRVTATGLLVVRGDTILHERYRNGANETSLLTSWSVAKSFTSTLVGFALADGLIRDLADPVTDYLPELRGTAYDGVPIRAILQMSSGVAFDETYGEPRSDINRYFTRIYFFGERADEALRSYPRERPPGEKFLYVSIDTQVLGSLVRKVTAKPLAAYLEEKVWHPLGMEQGGFWSLDREGPDGVEMAFCCLNATLRDYAKLGRLYLRHGDWNGRRLLPADWVREATTPSAAHLEPEAVSGGVRGYQYQWWVPPNPDREYFASGIWGQNIYVSEPDDLVIVRTSVDPDFLAHMAETIAVFRAIARHLRSAGT